MKGTILFWVYRETIGLRANFGLLVGNRELIDSIIGVRHTQVYKQANKPQSVYPNKTNTKSKPIKLPDVAHEIELLICGLYFNKDSIKCQLNIININQNHVEYREYKI